MTSVAVVASVINTCALPVRHIRSATGESIDLRTFARERLDLGAHPFAEKVRHVSWMIRDHGI
jgi:hypothetical protein